MLHPLALPALFLFGFLLRLIHLPEKMGPALAFDAMRQFKPVAF